MYYINDNKINETRALIVELMRDPNYMFDDNIRGRDDVFNHNKQIDLMDLIAYLYEIIHQLYFKEDYHYMFHWANKTGSWVDEGIINQMINERIEMRCNKNEK